MPIIIVPPLACQISSYLIVRFRIFQDLHINIHDGHAFRTPTQLTERTYKRHGDLRQPAVPVTWWTPCIGEYDG